MVVRRQAAQPRGPTLRLGGAAEAERVAAVIAAVAGQTGSSAAVGVAARAAPATATPPAAAASAGGAGAGAWRGLAGVSLLFFSSFFLPF